MLRKEIEKQALKLPIRDRKILIQSLLTSIEEDTQTSNSSVTKAELITDTLDPWTQSLIGVIELKEEDPQESYIDYLEEKYS